jgi:glycerol-3-phosphate dehydrogenase
MPILSFSAADRARTIARMGEGTVFDLAIIGGGITGAGVARDAASRGMKVALIEAADFASGTSSRSSKLIHGGIRYLENREFGLVFEALSERARLFELAPHLVHPLRFLIPVYRGGRVPVWKMRLGMWLYDALSLYEAPELHQHLGPEELEREYPLLRSQELAGGFTYPDAYMDDDRLVHET